MFNNKDLDPFFKEDSSRGFEIRYWHHIIFWGAYFLFNTLRWAIYYDDFVLSLKTNMVGFPIHMTLTYLNVYYLMPRFLFARKYVSYAALMLLALFIMLVVKFNFTYYLVSSNVMPETSFEVSEITLNYAIITMLGELYVISFATSIKITVDWLREHKKLNDLEKRQLSTELKFLRSQVSPHFFFNTLNNIYSLALEKSDKAPQIILKLSELMRYLLYNTKEKRQDLHRELEFIQNYLDLEQIRFDHKLKIEVNITGNLEDKKIAPMLLMPIIENCFKHGANKSIQQTNITIDLRVTDDFMYFAAVNTIPLDVSVPKEQDKIGGIGISNVRKRLELSYHKDDYELNIFEEDYKFHVQLKLRV